jgi:hypothetical protein
MKLIVESHPLIVSNRELVEKVIIWALASERTSNKTIWVCN